MGTEKVDSMPLHEAVRGHDSKFTGVQVYPRHYMEVSGEFNSLDQFTLREIMTQ